MAELLTRKVWPSWEATKVASHKWDPKMLVCQKIANVRAKPKRLITILIAKNQKK